MIRTSWPWSLCVRHLTLSSALASSGAVVRPRISITADRATFQSEDFLLGLLKLGWLLSLDTVGDWGTCVSMLETLQEHNSSSRFGRVAVMFALLCCRIPVLRRCWRGEPGRHRDRRAQQCPKRPMAAHPTRALTRLWCTPPRNTFQPAAPQSR